MTRDSNAVTLGLWLFVAITQSSCAKLGAQEFWDSEIHRLCEKDGGVVIYEKVPLSRAEVDEGILPMTWPSGRLGQGEPNISPPSKRNMHPKAPVYMGDEIRTDLNKWNPEVWRSETPILRTSDKKVVAREVVYFRIGGDVLVIDHPSGIHCPNDLGHEMNKLFVVQ